MDLDAQIKRSGCATDFEIMETCLGEFDRDWRQCQEQVKVFKLCMKDKALHVVANVENTPSDKD